MKRLKVTRVIEIEGRAEWVKMTLEKSLVDQTKVYDCGQEGSIKETYRTEVVTEG